MDIHRNLRVFLVCVAIGCFVASGVCLELNLFRGMIPIVSIVFIALGAVNASIACLPVRGETRFA